MTWFRRRRKPPLMPARVGSIVRTNYDRAMSGEWVLVGVARANPGFFDLPARP